MTGLFEILPDFFSHWLGIPISANPLFVINVVAALLLLFLGWYVWQAVRAWWHLRRAVRELDDVRQQNAGIITKDELRQVFSATFFASAWNGFRDTLHEQYDYQGGQRSLVSIRSTLPAEAIFSPIVGGCPTQCRILQALAGHPDRYRHHRNLLWADKRHPAF